jgi:hypothetical protein
MRRLALFALVVVAQATALTATLSSCDLGLAPFVEPDATILPIPDASTSSNDAAPAPPSDAGKPDASADAAPTVDGGKRIFLSSTTVTGAIGGIAAADAQCQALADKVNLGGTFIAFISVTGNSVLSRLRATGPWFLVNRTTRVFLNKNAIVTTFAENPINLDESGKTPDLTVGLAWTGTQASGTPASPAENCTNFTATDTNGLAGDWTQKGSRWTDTGGLTPCASPIHLYCIEQ